MAHFFELKIFVLRKRTRSDLAKSTKKVLSVGVSNRDLQSDSLGYSPVQKRDGICNSYLQSVSKECFYGNYFHFVRQEPNYDFSLQRFVLSFVAAIE